MQIADQHLLKGNRIRCTIRKYTHHRIFSKIKAFGLLATVNQGSTQRLELVIKRPAAQSIGHIDLLGQLGKRRLGLWSIE